MSEAFDRITRMAAQLFNLPIATVSLTDHDRQWFRSRVGVEHCSIPWEKASCAQVADSADCVVLPDLLAHGFYHDSLLAQSGIHFYADAPLTTREGFCLGAMCVLGTEPRQVSWAEMSALADSRHAQGARKRFQVLAPQQPEHRVALALPQHPAAPTRAPR